MGRFGAGKGVGGAYLRLGCLNVVRGLHLVIGSPEGGRVLLPGCCSSVVGAVGRGVAVQDDRVATVRELPERDVLEVQELLNGHVCACWVRVQFFEGLGDLGGNLGHGRIKTVLLHDGGGRLGEVQLDVALIADLHELVINTLAELHPL